MDIYDGADWIEMDIEDLKAEIESGRSIEETAQFLCRADSVDDVARKCDGGRYPGQGKPLPSQETAPARGKLGPSLECVPGRPGTLLIWLCNQSGTIKFCFTQNPQQQRRDKARARSL
jgi:hypothetical protein